MARHYNLRVGPTPRTGVVRADSLSLAEQIAYSRGMKLTEALSLLDSVQTDLSAAATLGTALPARMPESSFIAETPGGAHTPVVAVNGNIDTTLGTASNGYVVYLRGGNYSRKFIQHRRFSATNPVTIMSYPGERAIMVGDSTEPGNGTDVQDSGGLRFRNITFAARLQESVKFTSCQNIEVDSCLIRDSGRDMTCRGQLDSGVPACGWGIGLMVSGGQPAGYFYNKSANVHIYNSIFTNNGGYTVGAAGDIKHGHSLYLGGAGGINNSGCDGFVIANNLFFDSVCGNALQFGESAYNGFVVNNTINNTDTRSLASSGGKATWSSGSAIDIYANANTPHPNNITFKNNIISNNTGPACFAVTSFDLVNNVFDNNLVWNNAYAADWTTLTWYRTSAFGGIGYNTPTNDKVGDPGFKNTTGTWGSLSKDFSLNPGAYAKGKSDPAYTPVTDILGNNRSATPSLGAYE